jgi:odorant receptor
VYISSTLTQIFLPCYFGNELLVVSEKLAMTAFNLNWFDESKSFKTALKLFLENSKKPIKISVYKIFRVTLDNFLFIVNSAYSIYAVLKNFKV